MSHMSTIKNQKKHSVYLSGVPKMPWGHRTIKRHVGNGTLELDPSRLELYFSPNQINGNVIGGNELRSEFEKGTVPVLNACVLDYLLLHPELILEDWKFDEAGRERDIYFWGTIFFDEDFGFVVHYLRWSVYRGEWAMCAQWLRSFTANDHSPAAVLAK